MRNDRRWAWVCGGVVVGWWGMMTGVLASGEGAAEGAGEAGKREYVLVTAAQWGSKPATMPASANHEPRFITIHHAGEEWKLTDDPVRKLRGLQRYGQTQKNWPDLPYQFLIAPDGVVYEGRPVVYKPETNTKYDTTGHVGIMLWGNFGVQRVSEAQLRSAVYLTADMCRKLGISSATIGGHMDRAETACPGKDLYRYIQSGQFRGWVDDVLAGRVPAIELLPEEAGGPTTFIAGGATTQKLG